MEDNQDSLNVIVDLAGKPYWNEIWKETKGRSANIKANYYHYRFDKLFRTLIPKHSRILEVGCGGSVWLPYFGKTFESEVWGIDYSEVGVGLAKRNLQTQGLNGKIIFGDVFKNEEIPKNYFDVLWTYGFIEHFDDPQKVVARIASFVKPGGLVITLVPNLMGAIGWLQKMVDRGVYSKHVIISPRLLDDIHQKVSLQPVISARYFGIFSIGVVNFNHIRRQLPKMIDAIFWFLVRLTQHLVCFPFWISRLEPESRLFSPYIIGVYKK